MITEIGLGTIVGNLVFVCAPRSCKCSVNAEDGAL